MAYGVPWGEWRLPASHPLPPEAVRILTRDMAIPLDEVEAYRQGDNPAANLTLYDVQLTEHRRITIDVPLVHPEITAIADQWAEMAADVDAWKALARLLQLADDRAHGFTVATSASAYSSEELTAMVVGGISFLYRAVAPNLAFGNRAIALIALGHLITALEMLAEQGAHLDLGDLRRMAAREAYGL